MEIDKKLINKIFVVLAFFIMCFSSVNSQNLIGNEVNTSSIQALNMINVTIGGDFPISGSFPASRTERVDQLLTRILTQYRAELFRSTPDEQLLSVINEGAEDYAKRNITLKRFNGKEIIIDLVKFRLSGDFNHNPYLNNDDVLIFPPLDLDRNFVLITGAVNKEVKFEFVEGDRLSDAIFMAQGLNPAFINVDSASISRLSDDGLFETELIVHINDNTILSRGDRIRVLSKENKKHDYSVLVLGEVKNPGRIFISNGNTSIKEVIKKCGGFTNEASLKFAELIRGLDSYSALKKQMLEEDQLNNLNAVNNFFGDLKLHEYLKMYRAANLTIADTLFFGIDNQLRALDGYAKLDFRNLHDQNSYEYDFKVEDRDVIVIPKKPKDVYVWGGVKQIGNIKYDEKLSVWDYIDEAGGYTDIAHGVDEVYLIKGKSRDWIDTNSDTNFKIEAGDFIYVVKEVPKNTGYYTYWVAQYASIFGSIATIILLLDQIGK